MAVYKVIQDIEAEDKLLGPLTLKGFIYAAIAALLAFINFRLLFAGALGPLRWFFVLLFLFPMFLFMILASPLGREQPTEVWLLSRVRFLIKRLEAAEVVQSAGRDTDQVFFGAQVKFRSTKETRQVTIVGVDEVDPAKGKISWISPMAKALLKAREGDQVTVRAPSGDESLEIIEVSYPEIK